MVELSVGGIIEHESEAHGEPILVHQGGKEFIRVRTDGKKNRDELE